MKIKHQKVNQMTRSINLFLLILGVSYLSQVGAHHSFTMFDLRRSETLKGTVKSLDIVNPHSWLVLSVIDPTGKENTWSLEMGGASIITRKGWDKLIHTGDPVTATMHPQKDGSYGGQFVSITLPNGQTLVSQVPGSNSNYRTTDRK